MIRSINSYTYCKLVSWSEAMFVDILKMNRHLVSSSIGVLAEGW